MHGLFHRVPVVNTDLARLRGCSLTLRNLQRLCFHNLKTAAVRARANSVPERPNCIYLLIHNNIVKQIARKRKKETGEETAFALENKGEL